MPRRRLKYENRLIRQMKNKTANLNGRAKKKSFKRNELVVASKIKKELKKIKNSRLIQEL